jgi:hypothetical protein
MIAQLTSLALMIAALLLVLSLPLGDGEAGKALRRGAAFAFVMAFVPATLVCLVSPFFRPAHSTAGAIELLLAAFGAIGILVVLSLAAYGLIGLRKGGGSQPSAHADRFRHAKRRPEREEHDGHDEDSP